LLLSEIREAPFPWRFVAITLLGSWTLWAVASLLTGTVAWLLWLAGALAPALAGINRFYAEHQGPRRSEMRRAFWHRVVDPRHGGLPALAPAILLPVLIIAVARLFDGDPSRGMAPSLPAALSGAWSGLLLVALVGAMQELGWRGYMLDELQTRWSPLVASLLLGLLAWLWLLPVLFWPLPLLGLLRTSPGVLTTALVVDLSASVLLTWLYNRTRRAILAPLLARFLLIAGALLLGPLSGHVGRNWVALLLGTAFMIALLAPGFGQKQVVRVRVLPALARGQTTAAPRADASLRNEGSEC
jgi:membrane protease YdiL (CAAX protease family)